MDSSHDKDYNSLIKKQTEKREILEIVRKSLIIQTEKLLKERYRGEVKNYLKDVLVHLKSY